MKKLFFYLFTLLNCFALPLLAVGQGSGHGIGPRGLGRGYGRCIMGKMGAMWLIVVLLIAIVVLLALLVFKKKD